MRALLLHADFALRGAAVLDGDADSGRALRRMAGFVVLFGVVYGAVMGSFGGIAGDRALQVVISAVKVPLLLTVTFALSLPSFLVLNTLVGLRDDFQEAMRALLASQAALTIVLAALAPYTLLWYASVPDYRQALLFNAAMFGVAAFAAQNRLRSAYRLLIARDPRHRAMLRMWLILYAFVGIQMSWVLRPFVGSPFAEVAFFRRDAWVNAYEVFGRTVWNVVAGN